MRPRSENPVADPTGGVLEVTTTAPGPMGDQGTLSAVRMSEEEFRSIVRHSRDGIIIVDHRGTIVEWNEGEQTLTGIRRLEALGRPIWDLQYRLAPEERRTPAFLREAREKALSGLKEGIELRRTLEEEIQRPDGTRRIVQTVLFAVRADGDLFACGISRDVTDRILIDQSRREHDERLSLELATANAIQRSMLPASLPVIEGYAMIAFQECCEEVGGDLYDVARLTDGRLAVVIGDVSGKGIGAALLMSNVMACLRVLYQECLDPYCIADRINRELVESTGPANFVTLFLGFLDPMRHRIEYINAGHNPPLLFTGDGDPLPLAATGLPLGILPAFQYETASVDVPPNSLLCLYSDGIPEARTGPDFYGDDRLHANVRSLSTRPLPEIRDGIVGDVRAFLRSAPIPDDITLCLLKRVGNADVGP